VPCAWPPKPDWSWNSERSPAFSFIDALVAGRRPGAFKADPEDLEVLRTAIALRAARPGDATPDEQFVSDLYQSLAEQADSSPAANVHPLRMRRARTALVAVAASVALIGGTFAATESFDQSPATTQP
jgi:cytochrome b6-f complex iron-sulfur subunit